MNRSEHEESGITLEICLTPEMQKALACLGKRWTGKDPSIECFGGWGSAILALALAHPRELHSWMEAFTKYRDAEGLKESHNDAMPWEFLNARIAAHPDYKRAKATRL